MSHIKIKTLIVEDDVGHRAMWERDIADHNDEHELISFEPIICEDIDTAHEMLRTRKIDCGIFDLRLPKSSHLLSDANEGNSLLSEVLNSHPIPIAVVSGFLTELGEQFGAPIKTFSKDVDQRSGVLPWLCSHAELIKILGEAQNKIQSETSNLFHKSIWKRWQNRTSTDSEVLERAITRQIVAHLSEMLTISPESEGLLPEEFYVAPPIRTNLHTGDLLALEEGVFVVLTPRCNMANNSLPPYILLAKCDDGHNDWESIITGLAPGASKTKSDKAKDKLKALSTQEFQISSHFLPPLGDEGPWLVNFKHVITHPSSDVENLLEHRFASIAPHYIPNLVQRFSSYMGRIGQPDLSIEHLAEHWVGISS